MDPIIWKGVPTILLINPIVLFEALGSKELKVECSCLKIFNIWVEPTTTSAEFGDWWHEITHLLCFHLTRQNQFISLSSSDPIPMYNLFAANRRAAIKLYQPIGSTFFITLASSWEYKSWGKTKSKIFINNVNLGILIKD